MMNPFVKAKALELVKIIEVFTSEGGEFHEESITLESVVTETRIKDNAEEIDVTITHEESGDSKSIKIPISEQVAAWRKANPNFELKVEHLQEMLSRLFIERGRRFDVPNMESYVREDGTEMVRFNGPNIWGGAMPAVEWSEMVRAQAGAFIVTDPNFVKSEPE